MAFSRVVAESGSGGTLGCRLKGAKGERRIAGHCPRGWLYPKQADSLDAQRAPSVRHGTRTVHTGLRGLTVHGQGESVVIARASLSIVNADPARHEYTAAVGSRL